MPNPLQDKLAECVPSNWCDPLLTGPKAALRGSGGTWGCPDIERLLNSIRKRIATDPDLAALVAERDELLRANEQLHAHGASLYAENERLRKDAERYRWLRAHFRFANDSLRELWFDPSLEPNDSGVPADLDQEIDAALAGDGREG